MNVKGILMDGNGAGNGNTNWVVKEDVCDSISMGSISEDSSMNNSVCSSSSSELAEEASSSTSSLSTSSSSPHSNGPLYELSQLMNHLPLKRSGLSMFYQGKAQSFSCLGRVQSIEDLPKKERPYRKKMKSCKSYGGGLDRHRISYTTPKATISKKASRGPNCLSAITRRGSFLGG